MFSQLPTPSPDDLRAFQHSPEAIRAATAIKADLLRAIQAMPPFTVAAVARQFFPGEDDFQAVSKLGLEIAASLRELAAHGEDCASVAAAEKARLAPAMSTATRRVLEIAGKLPALDAAIRTHEQTATKKRAQLQAAGVPDEDIKRLTSADSVGGLIAEKAALSIEAADLNRFLATEDERHLPAGFVVAEPLKVSIPQPKLELPAFLRAA